MVQIDILTYNNIMIGVFITFVGCFLLAAISNFSIFYLQNSSKNNLSSITCVDFKNAAGLIIMCAKNEY